MVNPSKMSFSDSYPKINTSTNTLEMHVVYSPQRIFDTNIISGSAC